MKPPWYMKLSNQRTVLDESSLLKSLFDGRHPKYNEVFDVSFNKWWLRWQLVRTILLMRIKLHWDHGINIVLEVG